MQFFRKMRGESNKYQYLRSAKKGREGLCHQRTKTQAGHRALSEFAKKETLRIVPQQFLTIKRDTVQLTYPMLQAKVERKTVQFMIAKAPIEVGGTVYYKILLSNPIFK